MSLCKTKKKCYGGKVSATAQLNRIIQKRKQRGYACQIKAAYKCPLCGFWHLTKQEQR